MSGLIVRNIGAPTASSNWPDTRSTLPESSMVAESIFVPCSNSRIIMLEFSLDTLDIFFTPLVVPSTLSSGRVTEASTFSGLAPGYVVTTMMYGSSKLGSRSVVMPRKDTTPSTSTSTTATSTVYGFFTL